LDLRARIAERLAAETGTLFKDAPERVALVYPSPYSVGMSSLGFLTIYREINARPGRAAERAFLADEDLPKAGVLTTYESGTPVGNFRVVALSVAYELEIAGLIQTLEASGIPPLAADRDERHPFILCGGPLTNSNPLPIAPYADAIVMGEADELIHGVLDVIFGASRKQEALSILSRVPGVFVPEHHGLELPELAKADHDKLPAFSPIRTPHTELSDMFLVEAERGCSRGCAYCVMRRSTNGGMRIVDMDRLLRLVPSDARKVGLVGAAVSDHPKIVDIVEQLASEGRQVSLSSLRPDRLNDAFVGALKRGGARILTTALDAPSQRLRDMISRKAREQHLVRCAELAHKHQYKHLKLYMMVGLPGEQDEDIDELVRFASELSKIHPLALGIAPFVAKRNTPLDGEPFAGIKIVDKRLERLARGLKGRVDVRSTSARWAWIEYVLAQGGPTEGRAVMDAVHNGGNFAAYKRAFEALPSSTPRRALRVVQ
jgi:radical SAM superfamily enzyme YgiQ (UPF0313 family)